MGSKNDTSWMGGRLFKSKATFVVIYANNIESVIKAQICLFLIYFTMQHSSIFGNLVVSVDLIKFKNPFIMNLI